MILFEDANKIIQQNANKFSLKTEKVTIFDSLNRVLATDVVCDRDLPPFNRVAMDGYACKKEDLFSKLKIIDFVAAGQMPTKTINKGECAKVMTGCPLPNGADMVFKVELSKELNNNYVIFTGTEKDGKISNYCKAGEDNKKGEVILEKGTLLHSGHCGILSSLGVFQVEVFKQPKVGIIATGDELVEPDETPENHQIRNANSYILYSQCKKINCIPIYYGIAKDKEEEIDSLFKKAISECDVILMTGGVSMGDFDLVPDILQNNNFAILFNKVAVKPGKPTNFSVTDNKVCFGMPGNPVSTFMIFEVMVKPFLYKLMGLKPKISSIKLPLAKDITRKSAKRTQWIPIYINSNGKVVNLPYHGSGHFTSLANATGIISIPKGIKTLTKGQLVDVRQI
jgi:molybdopterin molybdotransferase